MSGVCLLPFSRDLTQELAPICSVLELDQFILVLSRSTTAERQRASNELLLDRYLDRLLVSRLAAL